MSIQTEIRIKLLFLFISLNKKWNKLLLIILLLWRQKWFCSFRNLEEKKIQNEDEEWTGWLKKDIIISSSDDFHKYFISISIVHLYLKESTRLTQNTDFL